MPEVRIDGQKVSSQKRDCCKQVDFCPFRGPDAPFCAGGILTPLRFPRGESSLCFLPKLPKYMSFRKLTAFHASAILSPWAHAVRARTVAFGLWSHTRPGLLADFRRLYGHSCSFPRLLDGSSPARPPRKSLRLKTLRVTTFACRGLHAFPPMSMKLRNLRHGGGGTSPPIMLP